MKENMSGCFFSEHSVLTHLATK